MKPTNDRKKRKAKNGYLSENEKRPKKSEKRKTAILKAKKRMCGFVGTKVFFPKINVRLDHGTTFEDSLRVLHFPEAHQEPPAAHLPVLGKSPFDWITLQSTGHDEFVTF